MKPEIIASEKSWEYRMPGHPESPERLSRSYPYLKKRGYGMREPETSLEEDVLLVHDRALVEAVKSGKFFDFDTPPLEGIYGYAMLSVSAAVTAMKTAREGRTAFSLMRPPGHHATRDSLGGFCYFNNIAIAVSKYLKYGGKAAIVDFDCHHGNGTQDIFMGKKNVLYVSLHQSPLYPGTGLISEKNCFNYPLAHGTGEKVFMDALSSGLRKVRGFKPDMIAVSAGFDNYRDDPITDLGLDISSYGKIAGAIASLGIPRFGVLEGGYADDLPACIFSFLEKF